MTNLLEKCDKNFSTMLAIDGGKIKAIREAKKLTQLYVASVIGVTTDTISRWENNRYPAIKRDNAEKLAAALETELADILRQEDESLAPGVEPDHAPKSNRRILAMLALAGVIVAMAVIFTSRQGVAPPVAARWLPPFASPGEIIPVQIRISRTAAAPQGFIIKERLPAGWRIVNAEPAPTTGRQPVAELKWLIPAGSGFVTISYTVIISPEIPLHTVATFDGTIVIHGDGASRSSSIGGSHSITLAGSHWADRNADGRIDDNEIMPAYYLAEEMKRLGLDWKTIESIWSGKGYFWDAARKDYVVVK